VATSPAGHIYVAGYESGTPDEGFNAWLGRRTLPARSA